MTGDRAPDDVGERLRRRLYRRGADGEDLAAFLAVEEPEAPAQAAPRPVARPHRPLIVALAGAAAVIVLLGVVHRLAGPGAAPVTTVAAAAPLPTAAVDAAGRAAFVARLEHGGDAGLAGRSADATEAHGAGPTTIALDPPAGARRMTVLLVLAADATGGWSAARLVIHDDRTIHLREQGGAIGALRAGVPAIGRLAISAQQRPTRLVVTAPDGARWGVAVRWSS